MTLALAALLKTRSWTTMNTGFGLVTWPHRISYADEVMGLEEVVAITNVRIGMHSTWLNSIYT